MRLIQGQTGSPPPEAYVLCSPHMVANSALVFLTAWQGLTANMGLLMVVHVALAPNVQRAGVGLTIAIWTATPYLCIKGTQAPGKG